MESTDWHFFESAKVHFCLHGEFPLVWDWGRAYRFVSENKMINEPAHVLGSLKVEADMQVSDEIILARKHGLYRSFLTSERNREVKFQELYVKFKIEKIINQSKRLLK